MHHDRTATFQVTHSVLKQLVPRLIGPSGSNIQRIEQSTGARITFPPRNSRWDGDPYTIATIRGTSEQIFAAQMQMFKHLSMYCNTPPTASFWVVPSDCIPSIVGRGGSLVQKVQNEFGVHIAIPTLPQALSSRIVMLTGDPYAVQAVYLWLQYKTGGRVGPTQEPPDEDGFYHTMRTVAQSFFAKRFAQLTHTAQCAALPHSMMPPLPAPLPPLPLPPPPSALPPPLPEEGYTVIDLCLLVPEAFGTTFVGHGGSNARWLEHQTGVSIEVSRSSGGHPEEAVVVTGTLQQQQDALRIIVSQLVNHYASHNPSTFVEEVTLRLLIPKQCIGRLIGSRGKTIKGMQQQSGATLSFPKPQAQSGTEVILTVRGTQDQLQWALKLILEVLHPALGRLE
eukprot:TRINITY_DN13653_c0_g1_i1.p1 TRINITY_DN13653_c0_g1~~TRINITY_DN13653_c0_g1_i1.p1  ORF type:complete len:405 (-),score=43.34 TRINITY_DN13653_c0_g1_i1:1057-2241(-)